MIARAVALRPKLVEQQAECEERTYYSEEMHEEFLAAGFYRLYVPRRYGGYEFDVPTFMRVVLEMARGCPSTALVHGPRVRRTRCRSGRGGRSRRRPRSSATATSAPRRSPAPIGPATRTDDGWELNGKHPVRLRAPLLDPLHGPGAAARARTSAGMPRMLLFVAPRSEWTMLDDWGDLLGLKGSGSHTIVFERRPDPGALGRSRTR